MTPEDRDKLQQIGRRTYEVIAEMVAALDAADDDTQRDEARETICQHPLDLEVRDDWYAPGARDPENGPTAFRLLLGTGGPAVRIVGKLSGGAVTEATLQAQDWFLPWTDIDLESEEMDVLLRYCGCFYFGE